MMGIADIYYTERDYRWRASDRWDGATSSFINMERPPPRRLSVNRASAAELWALIDATVLAARRYHEDERCTNLQSSVTIGTYRAALIENE